MAANPFNITGYTEADEALKNGIVAKLEEIYADFLVDFRLTRPTGEYSTIFVTGKDYDWTSLDKNVTGNNDLSNYLGLAEIIDNHNDKNNKNHSDNALIFTKNFVTGNVPLNVSSLAQVIAHEAGHLFGLYHVNASASFANELMIGAADADNTNIANAFLQLSEFSSTQNSYEELEKGIGTVANGVVPHASFWESVLNLFSWNFSSLGSTTLYAPQVAVPNASGAFDFTHLPDITASSTFSFTLPVPGASKIIFAAKSAPNGPYDIFSMPTGSTAATFSFDNLAVDVPDNAGVLSFNLGRLNTSTGSTTVFSSLSGTVGFNPPKFDLLGSDGDDLNLRGTSASESIGGLGGSDAINGGPGDDAIDGGSGQDAAVFSGPRSAYSLSRTEEVVTVSGPDGTDTLQNIELLTFTDGTISVAAAFPPHWLASVDIGLHPPGYAISGIGDFNRDSTGDVLWYNPATRDTDIWSLNNGQWAGSSTIGLHPAGYNIAGIGDFNRDGTSDVLWYNPTTRDTDIWLLNNGHWAASTTIGLHPAGYDIVGIGDFNDDGTSDVLWFNPTTRDTDIWSLNNGHWAASTTIGLHPAGYQVAGIGDFNNDGTSDVLWVNPTTNETDIWTVINGHWAGSSTIGTHPAGYRIAGVSDFNQDGTSDVVWYNPSNNDVDVWLTQNGHWLASQSIGSHPLGSSLAGIGDFDRNGVSDIFWHEVATNRAETWLLTTG
ncbi:MAG: FG-GAP-like repeat-containing protein [Xanthobacteraceae bacterium]